MASGTNIALAETESENILSFASNPRNEKMQLTIKKNPKKRIAGISIFLLLQ